MPQSSRRARPRLAADASPMIGWPRKPRYVCARGLPGVGECRDSPRRAADPMMGVLRAERLQGYARRCDGYAGGVDVLGFMGCATSASTVDDPNNPNKRTVAATIPPRRGRIARRRCATRWFGRSYLPPSSSIASSTLGGDSGRSSMRNPSWSRTAFDTAASGATIGVSPTPRTP